jgi:hypothetical protein
MDVIATHSPHHAVNKTHAVDFNIIIFKLGKNETRFAALGALDIPSSVLIMKAKSRCHEFNKTGQRGLVDTSYTKRYN